MNQYKAKVHLLEPQGLNLCGGEPVIFHCNHYNLFLQRSIEDAGEYVPAQEILTDGATSCVYSMLKRILERRPDLAQPAERLAVAAGTYSQLGFGILPCAGLDRDGGRLTTPITHYSVGWHNKWGTRDKPVDYFTCGYLAAAMAVAHYQPPGAYSVVQEKCLSMGHEVNEFVVRISDTVKAIPQSVGIGVTVRDGRRKPAVESNVDAQAITNAVRGIPLEGNSDGLIPAFGVFLTRHFANYYNYISFETVRRITEKTGEPELAKDLFVEAGHVCAFNTFGGIMESDEWYGLIAPQCQTPEDWASGMVAVANALGWGYWSLDELVPGKGLRLIVDGSYESNGFLAAYGRSSYPRSYLATGGAAGLMNLLYHGDITTKPTLDEAYYDKLFKSEESFVGDQVTCRSMGAEHCSFQVAPLHP